MTTARKDVQTAIVLQGGGALGAYEYGVLRALYEQRPGFRPVAVAGVSIGAITAAVLGGAQTDPISALDALWRAKLTVTAPTGPLGLPAPVDRSLAMFGNPGMYQLRAGLFTAPWLLTSLYDTAPLRQTLAELVDPARLNADDPRVIVGATNVGTGEMEFFDRDRPEGLTFEHVAASGSLPPSFPMTDIEGESYWDGGLFSNTPLGPAIDALEQAAGGDRAVERELVVVELFPMRAAVPQTMQDVLQRMMQLQYTSRLTLDARFFDKISRIVDLVDRVDATLAAGQRRPRRPDLPGGPGLPPDRSPQRRHLEPAPGAVQRLGLLADVGGGPDPGGVRRRDRAGDRQPAGAGSAVRGHERRGRRPRSRAAGVLMPSGPVGCRRVATDDTVRSPGGAVPESEPAVVTLEPATTAVIRRVVPMDRLPEFFDSSFGALAAAVTGQGAGIAGPAFALYHGMPTDTVDLEVGLPTQRAVVAHGDVVASALPGAASPGRCTLARSTGSARPGGGCAAGSTSGV
jgi:NTE family protein